MKDHNAILLISGILFSQVLAKILKKIIKQSRPIKSKTYGLPSSRATIISFIIFYFTGNETEDAMPHTPPSVS